eukprot:7745088-Pyramimonas_sp.AAC.1
MHTTHLDAALRWGLDEGEALRVVRRAQRLELQHHAGEVHEVDLGRAEGRELGKLALGVEAEAVAGPRAPRAAHALVGARPADPALLQRGHG